MEQLQERARTVETFIRASWDATVRETGHDAHPRLYLPYRFTVPCASDRFQELFYWDTYFAHLGLLRHGRDELVRANIANMFYMVEKYGFVLNSNNVHHLNRSQPPYLALMVNDLFESTHDLDFLRGTIGPLSSEYDFWMTKRSTPVGLNRHLHDATDHDLLEFYRSILMRRLGFEPAGDDRMREVAFHYIAEAESGHDFTPRFHGRAADFIPVDLNANLYAYERIMAGFSRTLGLGGESLWLDRAERRLVALRRYCWDGTLGCFNDYDTVNDASSGVATAASFWALAHGIATESEARATARLLPRLEREHGVSTCEDKDDARRYQWGYPNAWPPVQVMVCRGLLQYGMTEDARRIATKYIECVTRSFEATGEIWEKYDAETGEPGGAEYGPAKMLGWSAGAFVYLSDVLFGEKR